MNIDKFVDSREKTFKDVFKFYRRKNVKLDLTGVYNFSEYGETCHFQGGYRNKYENVITNGNILPISQDKVEKVEIRVNDEERNDWESSYGMLNPEKWEVFKFKSRPGLIYIRNPFKGCGQRYWIVRCLKDYTKKPNHLNIDALNLISEHEDWWDFCQRESNSIKGKHVMEKLRWATLGYHHNWDTKEYNEELKNDFPSDLKSFCYNIGNILGFSNFSAEAAIINIYHRDSSLSGHTDHSEKNLDAPLFSFSFGQSAVFLIGGKCLNEEPVPLLLQSGDIIIMSKESRLCYHGIPRIVETCDEPWNDSVEGGKSFTNPSFDNDVLKRICDNEFWKPFQLYMKKCRLNMNIRQVLLFGEKELS